LADIEKTDSKKASDYAAISPEKRNTQKINGIEKFLEAVFPMPRNKEAGRATPDKLRVQNYKTNLEKVNAAGEGNAAKLLGRLG